LVFPVTVVFADCGASTLQFQYDFADHVFHGSVFGKKPITDNPHQIIIIFSVNESFKGIESDKISVKFPESWEDEFEYGREYVMFAHGTEQPFNTQICTSSFFAFPTILKIVSQLDNSNNDFGDVFGYNVYDQLTETEKNQLEDISPSFAKERQKERDRIYGQVLLIGVPVSIGVGVVVMWVRTLKSK
jgi:hypothetical protein